MNKKLARVVLISAGIIWGLGFIGNKYVLDHGWNDSQLLFVRFISATIAIFICYYKRIFKTNAYVIKNGLLLGILLYIAFYFQTWGLVHTNPSNNALITAGYIVMMPLLIYIFERKKSHLKTIIAGFITLAGISLITVDFSELTIAFGDSLTFIGAAFFAIHIYFLGKLTKKVDLFVLMSFQLVTFSVLATFTMMLKGGFPTQAFSSFDESKVLILAILLGIFGSFIAFLFQSIGQKNTDTAEAAILISTESLFGPIFAILFYNDPFNSYILWGIILIFGGIVLSETDIIQMYRRRRGKKI